MYQAICTFITTFTATTKMAITRKQSKSTAPIAPKPNEKSTECIVDICQKKIKAGDVFCPGHAAKANTKNMRYYYRRKAAGICTKCLNPAAEGHIECDKHRSLAKSRYNQDNNYYYSRKAAGICFRCPNPAAEGRVQCNEHLALDRINSPDKSKLRYDSHKAAGICVECLNPAAEGRLRCDKHLALQKSYSRKRLKDKYDMNKAAGICTKCSNPAAEGRVQCDKHLALGSIRSQGYKGRAAGICTRCSNPVAEGRVQCDEHLALDSENYYKRKDSGICVKCSNPVSGSHVYCEEHLARSRRNYARRAVRRRLELKQALSRKVLQPKGKEAEREDSITDSISPHIEVEMTGTPISQNIEDFSVSNESLESLIPKISLEEKEAAQILISIYSQFSN